MRAHHAAWLERLSWAAIAVGGGALVVASFLPAFDLAIEAYTSDGSFRYARDVTFAVDLRPLGLVPPVAGALLLVAAAYAMLRPPPWWLAVGVFVVALVLAWLAFDTGDRLLWSDALGEVEPGAGPLLEPALDELEADAGRSPDARDPTWTPLESEDYDYARGVAGWTIFAATTQVLVWLTGYRVFRLSFAPVPALAIVAGATVVFWLWFLVRAFGRTA